MQRKDHHEHHVMPNPTPAESTDVQAYDGEVIRVALEARPTEWTVAPGVTISGYGYNGQVPGPVIEAKQGVPLEIKFTNHLPEPSIIHWHGLRIPAVMDGTQSTQRPV